MNGDPTMMFNGVGFVIDYNAPSIRNYVSLFLATQKTLLGRQTTQETTAFNFNPEDQRCYLGIHKYILYE